MTKKNLFYYPCASFTNEQLPVAGITVGAASAVLALATAPITIIVLAIAGLGIASGTALPGAKWLLD